jgi:hypothetical protein
LHIYTCETDTRTHTRKQTVTTTRRAQGLVPKAHNHKQQDGMAVHIQERNACQCQHAAKLSCICQAPPQACWQALHGDTITSSSRPTVWFQPRQLLTLCAGNPCCPPSTQLAPAHTLRQMVRRRSRHRSSKDMTANPLGAERLALGRTGTVPNSRHKRKALPVTGEQLPAALTSHCQVA